MKKSLFIFIAFTTSSYGYVNDSVYSYFIEKNVQIIDGCNKGVYPFNSQDTSKIKDLTLKNKVEKLISTHQYPTSFTFMVNQKKTYINALNHNDVQKLCDIDKPKFVNIKYYNIRIC